jgi:hypothetical protein
MASSDYDQKILGKIAKQTTVDNPIVSSGLYQILGLSVTLSKKVYKARRLRKLDTSRDTKSLQLYHQIIWTSREGLAILNGEVLPYVMNEEYGPESRVLCLKLRASFFHIICLFYNQPPISQIQVPTNRAALALPDMPVVPERDLPPEFSASQQRRAGLSPAPGRGQTLREPVTSLVSEGSVLTNPYPMDAPPGLAPIPNTQHPMSYLIPHRNYLPLTDSYFDTANAYAATSLPGSHPLRLSVALEYAAFLWDCQHDHERSRNLSSQAIRDTYTAEEGMEDEEFMDASEMVRNLHRMMKRKSWEGTPRTGQSTTLPGTPLQHTNGAPIAPTLATSAAVANTTAQRSPETPQQGGPVLGSPFVAGDQAPTTGRRRSRSGGSRSGSGGGTSTPRAAVSSKAAPGHTGSGGSAGSSGGRTGRRKSGGSSEATPRVAPQGTKRDSGDTTGSITPRAVQAQAKKSPRRTEVTPSGRTRRSSKS